MYTLKGHTGAVTACAFSADGTRFASGGVDGVVMSWRSHLDNRLGGGGGEGSGGGSPGVSSSAAVLLDEKMEAVGVGGRAGRGAGKGMRAGARVGGGAGVGAGVRAGTGRRTALGVRTMNAR